MDKFELEKLSLKMEALDDLLLAMETAIYTNDYDVTNYRRGFAYLTDMASEISDELREIVKEVFKNDKRK
ncbi:hypothetical protein [Fusobacterium animalis]|uniref:hypothetical protein n=1 Tax=Fusobacterium animalis TaxID=76859 RepID=UPI001C6EAD17|nr:hypothetical protein [Fusobacterium animalis]QYR66978.1 hypothetical protein JY401_07250 [Fusobacterium animalis]